MVYISRKNGSYLENENFVYLFRKKTTIVILTARHVLD